MPDDQPLTPLQGRVLFHIERAFRSVGGNGGTAHQVFLRACEQLRIPTEVKQQRPAESLVCLALIEQSCDAMGMRGFRDIDTQWRGYSVGR